MFIFEKKIHCMFFNIAFPNKFQDGMSHFSHEPFAKNGKMTQHFVFHSAPTEEQKVNIFFSLKFSGVNFE